MRQRESAASTVRVLDENQQIAVIRDMRTSAASFDGIARWLFLIVSVVIVGVALFLAGRHASRGPALALTSRASVAGSPQHALLWLANAVSLAAVVYGCVRVARFRAEQHSASWLAPSNTALRRHGAALAAAAVLCAQGVAERAELTPEAVLHQCSSPVLALCHALCWPYLLGMMSGVQRDINLLESKKYHISNA